MNDETDCINSVMNERGVSVVRSTGNVFRDVGFSREEAPKLAVRADLLIQLQQVFASRGLKRGGAANGSESPSRASAICCEAASIWSAPIP